MARYVNLDNLNDITIRLIRFFNSASIEDDDKKEQLAEIIHDLCAIEVIEEHEEKCDMASYKDLRLDIDAYIRIIRSKYRELDPNDVLYNPKLTKSRDYFDGMIDAFYLAQARIIANAPTIDVQAFFTEDEITLINEYKDEVKAVDFKTAILNAVSVALDRVDYESTEDTHDHFNEFANARDALKPLLAHFKEGLAEEIQGDE